MLAWCLAWFLHRIGAPVWLALTLSTATGVIASLWDALAATLWRRICLAAGFPLSAWALGLGVGVAPIWWLVPVLILLLAYPVRAWRDAPVFPTPAGALADLGRHAPLSHPAGRVHDAGCGMGDGLLALRDAYPQARLTGVEWSWLWWSVAWLRCRFAEVQRGDMWSEHWGDCDVVYLFQRPETMSRAMAKARAEMRPGTWLVSLEFEAADASGRTVLPHAKLKTQAGRPVWVYRIGKASRR